MLTRARTIARLLQDRADPNGRDTTGQTPLHKAAVVRHVGFFRALLEAAAAASSDAEPFASEPAADRSALAAVEAGYAAAMDGNAYEALENAFEDHYFAARPAGDAAAGGPGGRQGPPRRLPAARPAHRA